MKPGTRSKMKIPSFRGSSITQTSFHDTACAPARNARSVASVPVIARLVRVRASPQSGGAGPLSHRTLSTSTNLPMTCRALLTLAGWMRERDQLRDVALDKRLNLVVDLIEAGHFDSRKNLAELGHEIFLHVEARLLNSHHLVEFLARVRIAEVLVLVGKILE